MTITSPYLTRRVRSLEEVEAMLVMQLDARNEESECVVRMKRNALRCLMAFEGKDAA